jgi:hypothetical protein
MEDGDSELLQGHGDSSDAHQRQRPPRESDGHGHGADAQPGQEVTFVGYGRRFHGSAQDHFKEAPNGTQDYQDYDEVA